MFCRSRSSKIRRQKRRPFSMQVGRWSKVSCIKVSKISSATRLELGSAVSTACLAPPAAESQLSTVNLSTCPWVGRARTARPKKKRIW